MAKTTIKQAFAEAWACREWVEDFSRSFNASYGVMWRIDHDGRLDDKLANAIVENVDDSGDTCDACALRQYARRMKRLVENLQAFADAINEYADRLEEDEEDSTDGDEAVETAETYVRSL